MSIEDCTIVSKKKIQIEKAVAKISCPVEMLCNMVANTTKPTSVDKVQRTGGHTQQLKTHAPKWIILNINILSKIFHSIIGNNCKIFWV